MDVEYLPHTQHWNIKDGKCASGNQHSADKQVVDRLLSLKFHHASGNDIFVRMFSFSCPAVHDRVQHDHVQSHKNGCVENTDQFRRVSAEQVHVDSGRLIAADSARKNQ